MMFRVPRFNTLADIGSQHGIAQVSSVPRYRSRRLATPVLLNGVFLLSFNWIAFRGQGLTKGVEV